MPKQFGSDQRWRNGGAIYPNKSTARTIGALMYGAGDEFLSSSGFTQYEDCGIGWSHHYHLRQHAAKRLGRSNDLFEHRRTVDLFAQHEILVLCTFLAAFAVVNVGAGCIPADDFSVFIPQRIVLDKKPTILAIFPQRPLFDFKRQTA